MTLCPYKWFLYLASLWALAYVTLEAIMHLRARAADGAHGLAESSKGRIDEDDDDDDDDDDESDEEDHDDARTCQRKSAPAAGHVRRASDVLDPASEDEDVEDTDVPLPSKQALEDIPADTPRSKLRHRQNAVRTSVAS